MSFCLGKYLLKCGLRLVPYRFGIVIFLVQFLVNHLVLWGQQPQTPYILPSATESGLPEGASFEGVNESINLNNGDVLVTLPLLSLPGLGGFNFKLNLRIDSKAWGLWGDQPPKYEPYSGTTTYFFPSFGLSPFQTGIPFAGGKLSIPELRWVSHDYQYYEDDPLHSGSGSYQTLSCIDSFVFTDMNGTTHGFSNRLACQPYNVSWMTPINVTDAHDGSLLRLDTTNAHDIVLRDQSGVQYHFDTTPYTPIRIVDLNGNTITINGAGPYPASTQTITDSVNRTITITPTTITYQDSDGQTRQITSSNTTDGSNPISMLFTLTRSADGQQYQGNDTPSNVGFYESHSTLSMPTGETYTFYFDALNELTKIQYPSGGYTSYAYQNVPGLYVDSLFWVYGDVREIQQRAICARTDGNCSSSEEAITHYEAHAKAPNGNTSSSNLTMDVRDPYGNRTHYDFSMADPNYSGAVGKETDRYIYSGENTQLRTIHTDYYTGVFGSDPPAIAACSQPKIVTTTYNDANPVIQKRVEYEYDSYNPIIMSYGDGLCGPAISSNVTKKSEYNFDGSLLRTTSIGWYSSSPDGVHILDRMTSQVITDPSGFTSTKGWGYDGAGNLTSQTIGGTNVVDATTLLGRDSYGRLTSSTDPMGHSTTYGYDSPWSDSLCNQTASSPSPLPSSIKDALNHTISTKYNSCTSTVHSVTDANNQTTSYQYDAIGRHTYDTYPLGGGALQSSYAPSGDTAITRMKQLDDDRWIITTELHDGVGRITKQQAQLPEGTSTVETAYDQRGLVSSVSNPALSSSDATYGITSYAYDALGRTKYICNPDNGTTTCGPGTSYKENAYAGVYVDSYDEVRHHTRRLSDALNRLIRIWEPDSSNFPTLETQYAYNGIDLLTSVLQLGSGEGARSRNFAYSGRGELITSQNPESGLICYGQWSGNNCVNGYDANGNLLHKADALGTTTNYTYDALNRLTQKSYSDGTPTATFGYDGKMADGTPLSSLGLPTDNSIGRLSIMNVGLNYWQAYSYDPMGRIGQQTYKFPNVAQSATVYAWYDAAGNIINLRYPNGYLINQGWDSAARLTSSTLVNVSGTPHTQSYLQSAQYHPDGTPASFTLGNGAVQAFAQNNRLQMQSITVASPVVGSSPFFSHSYCYANCIAGGGGSANNGNIWRIQDTLNSGLTQDFVYDNLNRIRQFSLGGTVYQNFTVDSFGNSSQADSNGTGVFNFDPATNRISNMQCAAYVSPAYDGAGNQLCDLDSNGAARKYAYDAENRIKSISMASSSQPFETYTYLPDGTRMWKSNADGSSTGYINFGGQTLAEVDQDDSWTNYIYANGTRIARVNEADMALHLHGTGTCATCVATMNPPQFGSWIWGLHYTIKNGDKLVWRQYQTGNASAGIQDIWFNPPGGGPGSSLGSFPTSEADTAGHSIALGSVSNQWDERVYDLSAKAGYWIQTLRIGYALNGIGDGDAWFTDFAIVSSDGTVRPFYYRSATTDATLYGVDSRVTNASMVVDSSTVPVSTTKDYFTTFYAGDHLGTAQLEMSAAGWTVWKGTFSPYGMELTTLRTPNHYKFTGKERDAESGLDYFGARYYGSSLGRFMSPDWSAKEEPIPYAKLDNPQSLNLYSYVKNNPLSQADPDGHCCVEEEEAAEAGAEIGAEIGTFIEPGGGTAVGGIIGGVIGLGVGAYADYKVVHHFMSSSPKPAPAPTPAQSEEQKEAAPEPQTSTSGAGARQGGGRNSQKANADRVQSAKDKIADLKGQRDTLASKANKTPADKEALKKLDNQIKQQQDRMKPSENHSQRGKGQQ